MNDLDTVFAQRSNLLSPSFLRMVYDVVRFGQEAPKVRVETRQQIRAWSTFSHTSASFEAGAGPGLRGNGVTAACTVTPACTPWGSQRAANGHTVSYIGNGLLWLLVHASAGTQRACTMLSI